MIKLKRHLNLGKKISLFLIAAALFSGCGEEHEKTDYVARVNDSFLTRDEFSRLVDTSVASNVQKSEVIRNWIDRELVYQQAEKEGITTGKEYKRLIKNSEKELAGSFLLKKISSDTKLNYSESDILKYFEEHKDEFHLNSNSYFLNIISFSDEDKAVEFRALLLNSNWEEAVNTFRGDSSLEEIHSNIFLSEEDIHPIKVARVVKRLYPPEISIVISDSERYYTIVQLLGKYAKGTLPPFKIIKADVKERFIGEKTKEAINQYLHKLYSTNDIEVKY